MSRKWIIACSLVIGLAICLLPQAAPVRSQEATPENDANCVACHEHQYYVYDSGKWYCLCEAPMHCVYCHGGRTDSSVEEIAHEGLVLYPTREHAERCQTCHVEDYMARVVKFSSVAGVSSTPLPILTATPAQATGPLIIEPPVVSFTRLGQLEPWRLVGLGLLGLVFILVIAFGYRCWKLDCLSKKHSS
jgi:hypothetical protein